MDTAATAYLILNFGEIPKQINKPLPDIAIFACVGIWVGASLIVLARLA